MHIFVKIGELRGKERLKAHIYTVFLLFSQKFSHSLRYIFMPQSGDAGHTRQGW